MPADAIESLDSLSPFFEASEKSDESLGTLGTHTIYAYQETEEASRGIFAWIVNAGLSSQPSKEMWPSFHKGHQADFWTPTHEIQQEITTLQQTLGSSQSQTLSKSPLEKNELPLPKTSEQDHPTESRINSTQKPKPQVFSSLFSLASSVNRKTVNESQVSSESQASSRKPDTPRALPSMNSLATQKTTQDLLQHLESQKQQGQRDQDQGSGQQNDQQEQEQENYSHQLNKISKTSKSKRGSLFTFYATTPSSSDSAVKEAGRVLDGVENLYIRFMSLMARILGQAEAEGHMLYKRIKGRTDQIDTLIKLQSKLNNEKGAVDWSKDEEMKALLQQARGIGVEIPEDKFKWKKEEVALFKENITMRKDSMEKMTQLERTDMQRYLQEASQCHQARTNILKLIKEVVDTFVHNIRP